MGLENQRGWTRERILRTLRDRIDEGRPIIGAGSSAGIVAKSAEAGGADLIIVYSTGRSRMMGLATTPIGQPNEVTMSMYDEIANVVESTPIIGGAQAGDPTYLRLNRLVDAFARTGFDGVINFPSAGLHPEYARKREHIGQGLRREAELVAEARRRDLLTLGYAYTDEHTRLLTEAGVDILVPHAGWTTGGDLGADPGLARGVEEAVEHVQRLIDIARAIRPDVIALAHGGAIASPADTRELYRRTDAQGFLGASSIERIPIERAVRETVAAFKAESLTAMDTRVNDDPKE